MRIPTFYIFIQTLITQIHTSSIFRGNETVLSTENSKSIDTSQTISANKPIGYPSAPDNKIKLIRTEQDVGGPVCKQQAQCENLHSNLCFGIALPYKQTSLSLLGSSMNQSEVQRQMQLWAGLSSVPRCWSVIRPLLCAVYMPRCENGSIDLPSYDLCRITRKRCRIVEVIENWPEFLKCDKPHFKHQCKNEWREVKFNSSTARCAAPLVNSDHELSWIDGVEGCGLPCNNPLFTDAEHHHLRSFIIIVGSICLSCSLFAVVTFLIDWKSVNKYPGLIIFYINFCFLIVNIGWMAQFTPGAREDIVCRKDGTLRLREPSSGENLSCVIIFIMVYYFVMAAVIWFVFLTYSWLMSFRNLGKIRDSVVSKTAYFHLAAWCLPFVLTLTVLALGQIDGDSESGICFVGSVNMWFRIGFVVLPIFSAACVGGFFLVQSLQILIRLKIESADVINIKANARINTTIFRLVTFLGFVIFLVHVTIGCHLCEALRNANPHSDTQEKTCELTSRPSVHMAQLHIIAIFVCGIVMSSWVWTEATVETWKRFFRRLLRKPVNEPTKLKKHDVLAKVFAKKDLQNGGMSVGFYAAHTDPLGMNVDLNSATSQEVSSTVTGNVPKFLSRHGGLVAAFPLGLSHNSSASEDYSVRYGSRATSRRHSFDSQISLQSFEQEQLAYLARARQQRRLKKREMRRRSHSRILKPKRRGSDSSQLSIAGKKLATISKNDLQRPGSSFSGRPPLSELPILAPIRRNSASSNRAAEDLLRLGTSSGEESSIAIEIDDGGQNSTRSSFRKNDLNLNVDSDAILGDSLSCAIRDAVWGGSSLENPNVIIANFKKETNPKIAIELETIRPLSARISQTPTKQCRSHTPLNNLRQFPLLLRTALDMDGDSDIRETSSS
uniref:G-protein coupled receptors family 2 profile 2 domain-containing protein n=1 Tax=Strigamia maritima TaxID=126957 RepID=T1ISZ0_STRMM